MRCDWTAGRLEPTGLAFVEACETLTAWDEACEFFEIRAAVRAEKRVTGVPPSGAVIVMRSTTGAAPKLRPDLCSSLGRDGTPPGSSNRE
jgi:hypothetical protein